MRVDYPRVRSIVGVIICCRSAIVVDNEITSIDVNDDESDVEAGHVKDGVLEDGRCLKLRRM